MASDHHDYLQDLLNRLQAPIDDVETLFSYLTPPLDAIGLLPPLFKRYNSQPPPSGSFRISRHLSRFQSVILQHILPTWDTVLKQKKVTALVGQYFCPDLFSNALDVSGEVALIAYSTLLSTTLNAYAIGFLERLSAEYPLDRLFTAVHHLDGTVSRDGEIAWDDYARNLVMVPAKVANVIGTDGTIPVRLENGIYFNNLATSCEKLISQLSRTGERSKASIQPLSYLFEKLVRVGLFPSSPPTSRTQPSFFQTALPVIRSKLHGSVREDCYFSYWNNLLDNLPSSLTLRSILVSLFASLSTVDPPLDDSASQRGIVREEAILLTRLVGVPKPSNQELWELATSLMITRNWNLSYARVFVCWVSGGARGRAIDVQSLEAFMKSVLDLWSSTEHVKHSLLSQHQYTSSLLLLTASYFRSKSEPVESLAFSSSFIHGITKYLGHQDTSIRYCGMLVAEEVAHMCDKKLDFGGWDGDDSGRPWARSLRQLMKARDVDAELEVVEDAQANVDDMEVEEISTPAAAQAMAAAEREKVAFRTPPEGYDSDDSMTGYASTNSSRSPSPTQEELMEIEKDPSLNVGARKVPRPLYLKQLGDLLRGGGEKKATDDPHEADRIEMGLNCAEELIRKKANYGTELAENAVNLEYALLSLNNNYELEEFPEKRQGALSALVACAPRQAAPALVEEFFKNQYSVDQRYVALNALAMGARELASLPVPESRVPVSRIEFPSKMLPPAMHRKYITAGRVDKELVPLLMDDISRKAIDHQKQSADEVPALAREKALRIKKSSGVSEITSKDKLQFGQAPPKKTTFTQVAAELFLGPLINRFWLFLREEQTREQKTSHLGGRQKYKGTGTGLILNPLILSHFLRTLGILANASQNAPEWIAVIGPEVLELAVTIGTRPLSTSEGGDDDDDDDEGTKGEKEASVLASALELALVILDGSIQVDGGRTLGLEKTGLLLGVQEWAMKVFGALEQGLKVPGGGGLQEKRIKSTTAGVLLKIEEITGRWKRSMLDWSR